MLENRSDEKEIMDDLDISGEVIDHTLRELDVINRWLGGNEISIRTFKQYCKTHEVSSLVDLGCGGGDILLSMSKWTQAKGYHVDFVGVDANPHIVDYAKKNAEHDERVTFKAWNIFGKEFQSTSFDLIHCCLFTHHFSDDELIDLFASLKKQARVGVIINDLHRHALAYWSIKWLTHFFSKSYMVKNDAKVSVARGFKRRELKHILQAAGIHDYQLSWHWAFRWKLTF